MASEIGTGRALRILVAEDNMINQQLARALLSKAGHNVTVVGDGRLAVQAVQAQDYDVVLMDVQMPDMDGVEATRRIRALPPPKSQVPIVAVTAHAMSDARDQYLAAGMDAYTTKPLSTAALFAILHRLCGVAPAPSAPAVDSDALQSLQAVLGPERLRRLVEEFLADLPRRLSQIAAALEAGNLAAAGREAHAIAGTASNFGAPGVTAEARALEHGCRQGDAAEVARRHAALLAAAENCADALSVYRARAEPELVAAAQ